VKEFDSPRRLLFSSIRNGGGFPIFLMCFRHFQDGAAAAAARAGTNKSDLVRERDAHDFVIGRDTMSGPFPVDYLLGKNGTCVY
jgi:hypothetical protein